MENIIKLISPETEPTNIIANNTIDNDGDPVLECVSCITFKDKKDGSFHSLSLYYIIDKLAGEVLELKNK